MTKLPSVSSVDPVLENGWLTIWFNEPDSRNALSSQLVSDFLEVLNAVRDNRSVRGITLRGRGGVFCAGGDLKAFNKGQTAGQSRGVIIASSKQGAEMFDLVNTMPQVTIAFIEGAAMAGGFGIACCTDVVICQSSARFAMTETRIGLSPAQISPFVIQKLGFARARRLMLTAARFDGEEAHNLGFADFIGDDVGALERREYQIRKQVLECAPGAIADTKSLILAQATMNRDETIQAAAENFADRMLSDEAREGIASFLEKRKPGWSSEP